MENGKNIEKVKSSISNANSYEEIGEFWDEHDTAECWEDTYPVEFTINLKDDEDILELPDMVAESVAETNTGDDARKEQSPELTRLKQLIGIDTIREMKQ